MNEFSWLFYWGNVSSNLGTTGSLVLMCVLTCFSPDKDTVYAIAASEVGDHVLHSKTGTLAEQALDAWLQRQIAAPSK
jgi:hypothetical protein